MMELRHIRTIFAFKPVVLQPWSRTQLEVWSRTQVEVWSRTLVAVWSRTQVEVWSRPDKPTCSLAQI